MMETVAVVIFAFAIGIAVIGIAVNGGKKLPVKSRRNTPPAMECIKFQPAISPMQDVNSNNAVFYKCQLKKEEQSND